MRALSRATSLALSMICFFLFCLFTPSVNGFDPLVVEENALYNSYCEQPSLIPTGVAPEEVCKGNPPETAYHLAIGPGVVCTIDMEVKNVDLSSIPANATLVAIWTVTGPQIVPSGGNTVTATVNVATANPPNQNHPVNPPISENTSADGFIALHADGLTASLTITYGTMQQGFPSGEEVTVSVQLSYFGLEETPGEGWELDYETDAWTFSTSYDFILHRPDEIPEPGDFFVFLEPPGGSYINHWLTRARVIYNSGDGISEELPSNGSLSITASGGPNNNVSISGDTASCSNNGQNSSITVTATATLDGNTKTASGTFNFVANIPGDANNPPFLVNAGISILGSWVGPCLMDGAESVQYFYETNVPYIGYTSPPVSLGDEAETEIRFVVTGFTVNFTKDGVDFATPNIVIPSDSGILGASIGPSRNLSDLASTGILAKLSYNKERKTKYLPNWTVIDTGSIVASGSDSCLRYYITSTYKCKCGSMSSKTDIAYICDHNNTKNRNDPDPVKSVKCDYSTSNSDSAEAFRVEWSFLPAGIHVYLINVTSTKNQTSFAHRIFPDNYVPEWDTHYISDVMGCHPGGDISGGFEFRLFGDLIDEIESKCGDIKLEIRPVKAQVDDNGDFSYSLSSEVHSWNKDYLWSLISSPKMAFVEMDSFVYCYPPSSHNLIYDRRANDVSENDRIGLCFAELLLSVDFSDNLVPDYFRTMDEFSASPHIESLVVGEHEDIDDYYPAKKGGWVGKWVCVSKPEGANARFVYRRQSGTDGWVYVELNSSELLGRSKVLFWTDEVGKYDLEFRVFHENEGSPVFTDRIRIHVIRCNIVADYDRSGAISKDDDPAHDLEEAAITYYREGEKDFGTLVFVNCDDDDGNDICDFDDVSDTNTPYLDKDDDLAVVCIQPSSRERNEDELEYFKISVENPSNDTCTIPANQRIRLFGADHKELIGPHTAAVVTLKGQQLKDLFDKSKSLSYRLEGLILGAQTIITIHEKWKDEENERTDSIRVLCCPFIATPNTRPAYSTGHNGDVSIRYVSLRLKGIKRLASPTR